MTRAYAPAIGADRYADISDEDEADRYYDAPDPELPGFEKWADEYSASDIQTEEFWLTRVSDQISYGEGLRIAECLARCMKELDAACRDNGYQWIAIRAITTALSTLQQNAKRDAEDE